MLAWEKYKETKYAIKCGFSIDTNALGYGVVIPHHGTIVIGGPNTIGNFAVIHTSTCIAGGGKTIGDNFYLSTGSIILGNITIGDNVTVATQSLVNENCPSNSLMAGSPAIVIRGKYQSWEERDGNKYLERVDTVLKLKKLMNI